MDLCKLKGMWWSIPPEKRVNSQRTLKVGERRRGDKSEGSHREFSHSLRGICRTANGA